MEGLEFEGDPDAETETRMVIDVLGGSGEGSGSVAVMFAEETAVGF